MKGANPGYSNDLRTLVSMHNSMSFKLNERRYSVSWPVRRTIDIPLHDKDKSLNERFPLYPTCHSFLQLMDSRPRNQGAYSFSSASRWTPVPGFKELAPSHRQAERFRFLESKSLLIPTAKLQGILAFSKTETVKAK